MGAPILERLSPLQAAQAVDLRQAVRPEREGMEHRLLELLETLRADTKDIARQLGRSTRRTDPAWVRRAQAAIWRKRRQARNVQTQIACGAPSIVEELLTAARARSGVTPQLEARARAFMLCCERVPDDTSLLGD